MILYYNIEIDEKNENNDLNSLPLYFYKNNKDVEKIKEKLIKEEIDFCQKFNFYGIYYSLLKEGKNIQISDLEAHYKILPNDYLVFKKNNNNTTSFQFYNEIFKSAAKKNFESSIKSDNFEYIIKDCEKDRIIYGIFEDKLLTLFFYFNKLGLLDLVFIEENKLQVEEIYGFKNLSNNKIKKNIDKEKPIIITQENYMGKNYDLLILVPNIFTKAYKAFFIIIGTDKIKEQINIIKKDLNDYKYNYQSGIKKYIDCEISTIELVFIFDKDTQIELIEKKEKKMHLELNIVFLIKFYFIYFQ